MLNYVASKIQKWQNLPHWLFKQKNEKKIKGLYYSSKQICEKKFYLTLNRVLTYKDKN